MIRMALFFLILCLGACAGTRGKMPSEFQFRPIETENFIIAAWSRISDDQSPIHIYIEGDGHAFDATGHPTRDPTPHGTRVRQWASDDASPNVAYIARPCQYIMSSECIVDDWTTGRFSPRVIRAMSDAIKNIAGTREIILIGYSGGAMISGLVINENPDMNIKKWITVAGVLNHADWTEYFGDTPLTHSMNMYKLPQIPQSHYVAEHDDIVPIELSRKWLGDNIIIMPGAQH